MIADGGIAMDKMRTVSFRDKHSARAIFVILCFLLFAILLPVTASAAPTEAEAYSRMIAMKEEYPEGREWTNANHYAWKGGVFSGGSGCAGFAFILSDAAFGTLRARRIEEIDYDALRVGDILRINGDTHSVIILEKNANEVVIAEGNYNSSIHWGRKLTKEAVQKADYYLTRYPLPTHTVTFYPNGGSGTMEPQVVNNAEPVKLNANMFNREGYTFLGWRNHSYVHSDDDEDIYADQAEVTLEDDLNLYAQWGINSYTVTYDANGGQGTADIQSGEFRSYMTTIKNPFTREGYRFASWNTAADGSGTRYNQMSSYVITKDMVLYAQWDPIICTLRYNANSGAGNMPDQTAVYGSILYAESNDCFRKGYYFTAWNTDAFGFGTTYAPGDPVILKDDQILYAQWEPIICTLQYNANGGEGTMQDQIDGYGTILYAASNDFVREGYYFTAWNTDEQGLGFPYAPGDPITLENDQILYAQWEPIIYRVVITNDGNGTGSANLDSGASGTLVTLSFSANAGYRFKEWQVASGGITIADNLFRIEKEDVEIKACFEKIEEPVNIADTTISSIPKQIYTGKAIKTEIKVSYGDKTLTAGTDYSITYKDNKKPGKATVILTGKGDYTGEMEVSFRILPKMISLVSLKSGKSKQLTVKWKKGSNITGYEIQYSLKKNFKNAETITVDKAKTTSLTIPDLKSKKKYYVRIRAYRTVDGENYYSEWSKAMNLKVK